MAMLRDMEFHGLVSPEQRLGILSRKQMERERPSVAYGAYTADQRDEILEHFARPRWRHYLPYASWQFFCGTRLSEGLALYCDDIDVDRQWCQIIRSRNGGEINEDCKSDEARRVFKIPAIVCARLRELDLDRPGKPLFLGSQGGWIEQRNWRKQIWNPLQAELPKDIPRRPWEATRHTAITLQLESGNMSPYLAAKYFGTSEEMIRERYTRACKEWEEFDVDAGLQLPKKNGARPCDRTPEPSSPAAAGLNRKLSSVPAHPSHAAAPAARLRQHQDRLPSSPPRSSRRPRRQPPPAMY
ncbi:MAG TPA: hypothetical protein VEL28_14775 [Candidatus Binatia bacterium]|nr:hypothetical protein [Candidatus Binatia bacterium]